MKKYLFAALGAGLLMTSCQSDEPLAPGNGLEQQVAFTVSLPDAVSTRAGGTNSAAGGVSNNKGANVTFNVALYLIGGSTTEPVYSAFDVKPSIGNGTSATFEPTLVIGEQYRVVAYAKFDGDTLNEELTTINVTPEINNEQKDEYFANTIVTAAPELSATLKRPFGKLRLIAEDLHEAERQYGAEITNVDVTYQYTRPAVFNAFATLSATDNVYGVFGEYDMTTPQTLSAAYGEYEADTNDSRTIFVDYIPVDLGEQMMPFTVKVTFSNGREYTREFRQDIPVRRNWLTTLKGRLFTIDSDLTLTIEEGFEGFIDIDYVLATTPAELKDALENAEEGSTILLQEDVNYGTVTIGELKDVTIKGSENSVMTFVTDANTKIENVTLDGVDFVYDGSNLNSGIVIGATAQIDNLVVDGCTFTGTGEKKGRGIYGTNPNASIVIRNTTFSDLGYPIYTMSNNGGYKSLVIEDCSFNRIKSWAIMPQYDPYSGDLTVTGNKFTDCVGGLVRAGKLTAGHTFTFTNNVITNSTEHPYKNKWFQINTSEGAKVVEGNIKDGAAWTPSAADGLE